MKADMQRVANFFILDPVGGDGTRVALVSSAFAATLPWPLCLAFLRLDALRFTVVVIYEITALNVEVTSFVCRVRLVRAAVTLLHHIFFPSGGVGLLLLFCLLLLFMLLCCCIIIILLIDSSSSYSSICCLRDERKQFY